ncbi:MAG: AIR synthase-related protein, partial [Alphaproteobacteria bacterium]
AGFAVGAVERGGFVDGTAVKAGDVAIALPASGVHSNGYSLVRRIVEAAGARYEDPAPFQTDETLGQALLRPTRIYAKAAVALARQGLAAGMAHITGGGLVENPPRAFGKALALELDMASLAAPPVFDWLQAAGAVSRRDMARTVNCGVGMLVYVQADRAEAALALLRETGAPDAAIAGRIVDRAGGEAVRLGGLDRWPG